MRIKPVRAMRKRVRLGRLALPIWSLALAGVAVVAAAGQAVGPVLSGSVTGVAGLTVEQSVLLDPTGSHVVNDGTFFPDGDAGGVTDQLVVSNDEGTTFTAAIEMHVGSDVDLTLAMENVSDADANSVLELSVPKGIDVEIEGDGLSEAQMTQSTWLMEVPTGTSDLHIMIEPKDDLRPGFYTISGRIVQIQG